jgi:hypothetical protein
MKNAPAAELSNLIEKERIIETVTRLFINTDNRDWPQVKGLFSSRVLFDMTSLSGGQPATMTPQDIVEGWNKGLKALRAIHHQAGNHIVSIRDNEATLFCYGIALHYLPNKTNRSTRTFVGSYDIHLIKQDEEWKIDRFKFNLKFIDGNPDLEAG